MSSWLWPIRIVHTWIANATSSLLGDGNRRMCCRIDLMDIRGSNTESWKLSSQNEFHCIDYESIDIKQSSTRHACLHCRVMKNKKKWLTYLAVMINISSLWNVNYGNFYFSLKSACAFRGWFLCEFFEYKLEIPSVLMLGQRNLVANRGLAAHVELLVSYSHGFSIVLIFS